MTNLTQSKKIDVYDRKILFELDMDARIPASGIARKIRLPKETVNFRIRRLLQNGYISSFYTIVNGALLGYQYYKVFFRFKSMTPEMEVDLRDFLLAEKSCVNVRISDGFFDLCYVSMQRSPEDLKEFMFRFHRKFGAFIESRSMNQIINSYRLNQKFLYAGKPSRKRVYHGRTGGIVLSDINKQIISVLSTQARIRLIDISRKVGVDSQLVSYHMRNLERSGVIIGYFTSINMGVLKRSIVQVDVSLRNPEISLKIIDFFDSTSYCIFASEMLGKYDLTVELSLENDGELRAIMQQFKEKFKDELMSYDVSRVYHEFVVNWSPFDAVHS
jgi:DNA-binding Lrp family transcriptional regulator